MQSSNYFSLQMTCFKHAGMFVDLKTQKIACLYLFFKFSCTFVSILSHCLFFYQNTNDVAAMSEVAGYAILLSSLIINFAITLTKRKEILKLRSDIEALTTNSEEKDESLLKVKSLEKKATMFILFLVMFYFCAVYFTTILKNTAKAALGYGFALEFPTKVAFPYEINSLPLFLAHYVVVCYGMYSMLFFSVSL